LSRSVSRPVNALVGTTGPNGQLLGVTALAELGARRISVGSALSRAAFGAFFRAARELRESGTFEFMADALPYSRLNELMQPS
jgi:2-methylisocitrate lyase-like PEP mutase family enzyme